MQSIVIQVKVKPRSRVSLLTPAESGAWLAQVRARPEDGKANDELVDLVAAHFHCRRSAVSIRSGASSRTKSIRIEGVLTAQNT
jgi:uncharacterized protein (TIGR00251 family)